MPDMTCPSCGTSLEAGMKFCRRCGTPLDPTEAATRSFDEPVRVESMTQPTTSSPTSPTFVPPSYAPPVQPLQPASVTNNLQPTGQKKTVWILAGVALVSLIAVIVLLVMLLNKPASNTPTAGGRGDVTAPEPPPPPPPTGGRGVGIPPPPQPPVPTNPGQPRIDASLRYPGAQVMMEDTMTEGKVLMLRTNDSIDKVVEWYKASAGVKNEIQMPGKVVMLVSESFAITISPEGGVTSIMVASGDIAR